MRRLKLADLPSNLSECPRRLQRADELTRGWIFGVRDILSRGKETGMPTATITSKGQITIPKKVRSHLGVAAGDRLDFTIGRDGTVRVLSLSRPVRDLFGLLRRPGQKIVTLEEMDASILGVVSEEDARARREK
jgi:antitoxin PrlF